MSSEIYKFVVSALLDDFSLLKHHDDVRVFDGLDPVRDVDAGAAFHQPIERVLDLLFVGAVEG